MKLSISNIAWDNENNKDVYSLMKRYGYTGLEIAPTKIIPESPYDCLETAKKWSTDLEQEYEISISSMQSIWFGRGEKLFGTHEERKVLKEYTKKAIDFANVIGCKNLVFGCPRNRNVESEMSTDCAIDFFGELGDYAYKNGTVIGMEANPTIYNTNYVNETMQAIELIRKVNSKGFLLNLDLGTIIQNDEDISELTGNVHLINHVHISEPGLKPIQNRDIHTSLKKILIKENYQGYISIEMGTINDLSVIENTLKYVEEVFR